MLAVLTKYLDFISGRKKKRGIRHEEVAMVKSSLFFRITMTCHDFLGLLGRAPVVYALAASEYSSTNPSTNRMIVDDVWQWWLIEDCISWPSYSSDQSWQIMIANFRYTALSTDS